MEMHTITSNLDQFICHSFVERYTILCAIIYNNLQQRQLRSGDIGVFHIDYERLLERAECSLTTFLLFSISAQCPFGYYYGCYSDKTS